MFGFFNCNKPIGFTSRDVVNVIQGRLRGRKIKLGHCGTLDPLADGVLVVAAGPASRLVPFVHQASKAYQAVFRLGSESPTGDLEVEPTQLDDPPVPSLEEIESVAVQLTGELRQTPPAYSAIKIGGKRAYELVRRGESVEVPSRVVRIHSIDVVRYDYPDLELKIVCGTGTYIRTLGIDLAKQLGTVAVMTRLTRTRVGEFQWKDSVSIEQLRSEELPTLLQPARLGVSHFPQITITDSECRRLKNGQRIDVELDSLANASAPNASAPNDSAPNGEIGEEPCPVAAITTSGQLQAIVERRGPQWVPKRVFHVDAAGR
jgi:tRNA pseudouridine55 synthase